ncbi:MAG: hypothetical protein ACR2LN_00105 [Candidatus Levyibacteriota bacterium]
MRTKWLILIIVGIVSVMLAAAWIQRPKAAPAQIQQVVMRTYTDPGKVFSVAVPSTWSITPSSGSSTTGLNSTHPLHQAIQITQFTKPAEMGLTVQVLSGQPACPLAEKPTTTVGGLPASYNPAIYTWSIPTTNTTVLVSVAYPGTNSFHGPLRSAQPTPLPKATVDADKHLVLTLLKSLSFSDLKPLVCE